MEPLKSRRFLDAAIIAIASMLQSPNSLMYYPLLRYLQFGPVSPLHGVEKVPPGPSILEKFIMLRRNPFLESTDNCDSWVQFG